MNIFKSHFRYNKSQRNGILFLFLSILFFQGFYFFTDFTSKEKTVLNTNEIRIFQKNIDSLKRIEIEKRKPKVFPYNPSFITDYKGYKLGMNTQQIDRIHAHRNKGLYINSAKHFQKVTKVSDSLLAVMSLNFKFPDWVGKKRFSKKNYNSSKTQKTFTGEKQDLNMATAIQLQEVSGIGVKLSERIIKFRKSLSGFPSDNQLAEVYGLKPEVVNRVLERFTVLSKPKINKINVNTATFKQVLHLPYIDYELTKKIFQYRDEVAEIQDLNELKTIEGFPLDKFDKIAVYLEAK